MIHMLKVLLYANVAMNTFCKTERLIHLNSIVNLNSLYYLFAFVLFFFGWFNMGGLGNRVTLITPERYLNEICNIHVIN